MSNPLSALLNAATVRREVKIRGATITLRLLTVAEVYALITAVPVVLPPTIVVNGVATENRRDPAFIAGEAARARTIRLGELALAMDLTDAVGKTWGDQPGVGERRAWLIQAERQIETTLLATEVSALEKVLRDMEEAIEKDIRGN